MIAVDDLGVTRGGVTVLDDVSLTVESGAFVGLVGPNGAGKTTLLHTANGVLAPESGTVQVDGRDVHRMGAREVARLVATVPQDTTVGFDFTVEDIVAMGRTPYHDRLGGRDEGGRDAVQRALARTDTAQFADRPIGTVSGGQRQRVLLARALAQDTPVLLLDEPTASLDVNHQVRTLELVADVVAGGKTAVAAIHDLDLAARFCDRLVVVSAGRVVASGPPESVLDGATVGDAYGTDAAVATDPVTGTPLVRALGQRPDRDCRVHVVGGGTAGAAVIGRLHDAGLTVTAGPLPAGDAAVATARARDCTVTTAPAFGDLAAETVAETERATAAADVTVAVSGPIADAVLSRLDAVPSPLVVAAADHDPDGRLARRGVATTVDDVVAAVLGAVEAARATADD